MVCLYNVGRGQMKKVIGDRTEKASDKLPADIKQIKYVLSTFREEGKVLLAYLFGSYVSGTQHKKSDIDIALYLNTSNEDETIEIIDKIMLATESNIEVLRLDDEDESPFIVQEALKGIPLINPDYETLYRVYDRVLHEAESIRFKRDLTYAIK